MQLTAEGLLAKGNKTRIVWKSESDSQAITVKEVTDVDARVMPPSWLMLTSLSNESLLFCSKST